MGEPAPDADRDRWRSALAVCALMTAMTAVFVSPLFRHVDFFGIHDWDYFYFKQGAAARTILEFKQFPLWNPWIYGGLPMLADPESAFLSPTFWVHLVFGEIAGLKIEIGLLYLIGCLGSFVLARQHALSRSASVVAAIVFMFGGVFSMSLGSGMVVFMAGAYIPWVFWAYLRSLRQIEYAFLSGGALAAMFLSGGSSFGALTGLGLAVHAGMQVAWRQERFARTAVCLTTTAFCSAVFSSVKLLPALHLMAKYPKQTSDEGGFSATAFAHSLLDRDQDVTVPWAWGGSGFWDGLSWGPQESGMYIGIAGCLLLITGIVQRVWVHRPRLAGMPLLSSMLVMIWLSFGVRAPVSLWKLVHLLPVFESMRVPERFRVVFFIPIALFVAYAADAVYAWIRRRMGQRFATGVAIALPAALFVDYVLVNAPSLRTGDLVPPVSFHKVEVFEQADGLPMYDVDGWLKAPVNFNVGPNHRDWPKLFHISWYNVYPAMLSNRGVLTTDADWPTLPSAAAHARDPRYRGEVFVEGSEGSAAYVEWSPNRLVINAQLAQKGLVVVNQNHDDGWRATVGRIEANRRRLAVALDAGRHRVVLTYQPRLVTVGLSITAISVALSVAATIRIRRRRRR